MSRVVKIEGFQANVDFSLIFGDIPLIRGGYKTRAVNNGDSTVYIFFHRVHGELLQKTKSLKRLI